MSNSTPTSESNTVAYETTLEVRDSCLCLHVQRAARAVARRYDEALRPLGITNGQFSLMMSLNRPQPPAMKDVASLLAMDRTTLTANLKPLEKRGLIQVKVDPHDRRGRRLLLTDQGRELLAEAVPLWRATQEENRKLVNELGLDSLLEDLRALS
ncbi:MarR family winged helix-turn-helix transcriptional regulator [Fodinicurvata halophila]|uniref:MarR family winged helix-turn-helix transcriptional regulator n=1 Tax=Fodinicurvata halophila TaxID=1419723 RepID=A0ABV8UQA9_9PROT